MINKIKPEEWKIFIECPVCHRQMDRTSKVIKRGLTNQIHINLPNFCVYCEEEKNK